MVDSHVGLLPYPAIVTTRTRIDSFFSRGLEDPHKTSFATITLVGRGSTQRKIMFVPLSNMLNNYFSLQGTIAYAIGKGLSSSNSSWKELC